MMTLEFMSLVVVLVLFHKFVLGKEFVLTNSITYYLRVSVLKL